MVKKLITILLCTASLVQATTTQPQRHSIMSYEEYAHLQHAIPYTFELNNPNQVLFYFGANHSCDPDNEQYPLLESFWKKFLEVTQGKNCIVLVEGSKRPVYQTKEEAITRGGGEGGLITWYAAQAGIPTACPEPDQQCLMKELRYSFSEEEIAYKDFAQATLQYNRYKKEHDSEDFKTFIQPYLERGQRFVNIDLNLPALIKLHEKLFQQPFNPSDEHFFYTITNPVVQDTVINRICRQASSIRDQHIVHYLETLTQQGKNIFIVYGDTHAIMQEAALRTIYSVTRDQ